MSDLLLLSGGIDSTAIAAWLRPAICLTIDYGQLAADAEIQASKQICKDLEVQHEVLSIRIPELGAGDMSGSAMSLHSVHSEFWPFRNQFLITLGAMWALKHEYRRVVIGTVATDNRHVDGSAGFIQVMDQVLSIQEGNIRLAAPASKMSSVELVRYSAIPLETLAWAHSCHTGNLACGHCPGCRKHSEVMGKLGWER